MISDSQGSTIAGIAKPHFDAIAMFLGRQTGPIGLTYHRTSLTDAAGNVTRYAFDRRGRLVTETDPLQAITSYAYDLVGNKIRETDRLGRVTTFVYDAADRLVEERWQQSAAAGVYHTIKRIYDGAGQLIGVTETDTVTPAATTAWQFTYDASGNVVKSRMAPGEIVQQPISWTGSLAAGDALIDWDGDGQGERYDVSTITVAPGDVIEVSVSATAAEFVPLLLLQRSSRPTELVWFESANSAIVPTALVDYHFTYDKAGNLLTARKTKHCRQDDQLPRPFRAAPNPMAQSWLSTSIREARRGRSPAAA